MRNRSDILKGGSEKKAPLWVENAVILLRMGVRQREKLHLFTTSNVVHQEIMWKRTGMSTFAVEH